MLVSSTGGISFVFFFYGDIQWGRFSNIGFQPSRFFSSSASQPFMIPIGLTNATIDIEETSNFGSPGSYAFRVDLPIIQEPEGKLIPVI